MTRIIRNAYQTVRSVTEILGESKVQATVGNDTDVNRIMERFTRTGIMPQPTETPQYADVTALQGDPQEILQRGKEAEIQLAELQAEAKRRLDKLNQENDEKPPTTADEPPAETPST